MKKKKNHKFTEIIKESGVSLFSFAKMHGLNYLTLWKISNMKWYPPACTLAQRLYDVTNGKIDGNVLLNIKMKDKNDV